MNYDTDLMCCVCLVFRDVNTPSPFTETLDDDDARAAALPDHVYMDAMGFGMGCCCLQVNELFGRF